MAKLKHTTLGTMLPEKVDGVSPSITGNIGLGAVRYNASQSLATSEKAQARTNIGAAPLNPLAGQTFDFSTTQGFMEAIKAVVEALGGTVTNMPGGGGGSYTLNADGTVSTDGTLNPDGTLSADGTLNNDGTMTVEAS